MIWQRTHHINNVKEKNYSGRFIRLITSSLIYMKPINIIIIYTKNSIIYLTISLYVQCYTKNALLMRYMKAMRHLYISNKNYIWKKFLYWFLFLSSSCRVTWFRAHVYRSCIYSFLGKKIRSFIVLFRSVVSHYINNRMRT